MSNGNDEALVFSDGGGPAVSPGTHVLIIGVGKYAFGVGRAGYFARPHDFQSISACRRGRRIVVVSPAAVKDQRRIQGLRRASGADPS